MIIHGGPKRRLDDAVKRLLIYENRLIGRQVEEQAGKQAGTRNR